MLDDGTQIGKRITPKASTAVFVGADGKRALDEHLAWLDKNAKKIAMIGPNVKRAIASGGGSAGLNPYYNVTPWQGLQNRFDGDITFAQGCDSSKWLPLASPYCQSNGETGVQLEYYKGDRFSGEPAVIQHKVSTDLWLWDSAPMELLLQSQDYTHSQVDR